MTSSGTPGQPESANKKFLNQTARRLEIKSISGTNQLVIPPFGSVNLSKSVAEKFDLQAWEDRNLLEVKAEKSNGSDLDAAATLSGCLMLVLVVLLPLGLLAVFFKFWDWQTFIKGTVGVVVIMAVSFSFALAGKKSRDEKESRLMATLKSLLFLPGPILVLLLGLGIPGSVIYLFGGGKELLQQGGISDAAFLGRSLQLGFIAIACIFPGLMYFMFGRQELEKLRESFIREVMMLDPNVQTTVDAKSKYDSLFDTVHGTGTPLDPIPIYISTALITLSWILILLPIGRNLTIDSSNLTNLFSPSAAALNYGFLGAYFFTINMVFRRYVRSDLTPKTYTYISIRYLFTAILVWAISSLPFGVNGDRLSNNPYILALAFFIGIFPETGLALVQDVLKKVFGKIIETIEEQHPLTELEGINLYDRTRLLEEGIENVENLAHSNLIELLARTRIPTGRLVDLFDQALLYLHLGSEDDGQSSTRTKLQEYGIRTATELERVLKEEDGLLKGELGTLENKLKVIECALSDDEWMVYLRYWRESTTLTEDLVTTPEEFYGSTKPSSDSTRQKEVLTGSTATIVTEPAPT